MGKEGFSIPALGRTKVGYFLGYFHLPQGFLSVICSSVKHKSIRAPRLHNMQRAHTRTHTHTQKTICPYGIAAVKSVLLT